MRRLALTLALCGGCGGLTPHTYTDVSDTDPSNPDDETDIALDTELVEDSEEEDSEVWDTGGGADTDDGTPVDTDTPVVVPPNWTPDGTYRGSFKVRYFVPVLGDQLCQGQVRIDVDRTQNPPIDTQISCNWTFSLLGPATIAGYGDLDGLFEGYINAQNNARAVGTLRVTDYGDFDQEADWTGTFVGDELTINYDNVFLGEGIRANFTLTR
jgi:hypothetical protein